MLTLIIIIINYIIIRGIRIGIKLSKAKKINIKIFIFPETSRKPIKSLIFKAI
jgi:hypothetical protein